jgi:phospholipid transport system transporter-binding protein
MAELVQYNNITELVTESENKWQITGEVLVYNANLILKKSAAFKMDGVIEVDFSGVSNVDTSALSLMLEWQRRATAVGCTIKFANLPADLSSLASLYGVGNFISLSTH